MINNGTWVGRLTNDPSLTYTPDGKPVVKFTLAVSRSFKNKQGEIDADFIPVEFWGGNAAENVANTLQKGDTAGVPGAIRTSSRDKDGRREYFWSVNAERVQFITVKKWNENNQSTNQSSSQNNNKLNDDPFTNDNVPIDIDSDDLPF
ncbi:single-stranded DNA-binding protein [Rossellomorea aquimaris]|uniref:single-stranded DNA-binding protein n=1 Tax=Rossellomorea aquimaris TaxID=189382 RepID=UPI0011E9677B|nr:single-stranded DNA-binding protein [Rossellomorea aquimaris]TYS91918.1 single-stranded DNA-binding protein [Rossellomorea aquimaris]